MKIENFSNYEIYPNEGKIWSYKSNRFIGSKSRDYWHCALTSDDGNIWGTKVHRVIWTAVYGSIPDGFEINHLDENKDNNRISNLELTTHKENCNYGTRTERSANGHINGKKSKPVGAYKDGVLKMIFPSLQEAQRNNFIASKISACCRGKIHSHKGYSWQYINNE